MSYYVVRRQVIGANRITASLSVATEWQRINRKTIEEADGLLKKTLEELAGGSKFGKTPGRRTNDTV